jgi:hypothetical protein
MNTEELVARLENVALPDIVIEDHRRELRASLLAEYARRRLPARTALLSRILSSMRNWKTVAVTSAAWVVIVAVMTLLLIVPAYRPNSTAMAIDAVLANPQVRSIMAGDEMASVTVTPLEGDEVEVVISGGRGTTIIARVDVKGGRVTIVDVAYVILFGSIFEPEKVITGHEAEKVIAVASTNYDFRRLTGKGAIVEKIVSIEILFSTRHLSTGETTGTRGEWAMVTLALDGKEWSFLVDPLGSRVINRSTNQIP